MSIATVNPSTGETERVFVPHDEVEVEGRLALAAEAFASYRRTSIAERGRWMLNAAELLEGEVPVVASTMTTEMGKTFASAKGEVGKCARVMRWFAEHAGELLADDAAPGDLPGSRIIYRPIGTVLGIMPWNFPLWQVIRFAVPALMAGNTGLLKHSSNVPQTALLLEDVFRRAGLPNGAFQTVLVGSNLVERLISDPRVHAVTFTGSKAAGSAVAANAGRVAKKSVLELGGSDPFIVMPSADLDRAAAVAVQARIQNNGQSCIAAKRFIVHQEVYKSFESSFVEMMAGITVGDPFDPATEVGPLALASARDEIHEQVQDAVSHGATILCGGKSIDGPGFFYQPTVLTGVTPDMRIAREEVFGPVAVIASASDSGEALRMANATEFGLGASVWTSDPEEQELFVEGIDSGMVFVNDMVTSIPELPFGGVKASGYGRELSSQGIREFSNIKSIRIA